MDIDKLSKIDDEEVIDLSELLYQCYRNLWKIIVAAIVGALIGYFYSALMIEPTYSASADIIVYNQQSSDDKTTTNDDIQASTNLASTYSKILKSHKILENVISTLNLKDTYETLYDKVSIENTDDTQVVTITVTDTNSQTALKIVKEIVDAAPEALENPLNKSSVITVDDPWTTGEPVGPDKKKNAMIGGLAGALLVIAITAISVLTNNTIKVESQLEELLDTTILAVIPIEELNSKERYGKKSKKNKPTTAQEKLLSETQALHLSELSDSFAYKEAYKTFATNVAYICESSEEKRNVIMLASSNPHEGKTSLCVNLAAALSNRGKKVILLDGDLRKGTLTSLLKLPRQDAGLTNLLEDGFSIDDLNKVIKTWKRMNFDVIPSGSTSTSGGELLGSERMRILLKTLRLNYDYVICDTAPIQSMADALELGKYVDDAILVVKQCDTTKSTVLNTKQQLSNINIPIMGAVLNMYDPKNNGKKTGAGYSYYNYGYYNYGYGYGEEKKDK